jgi:hypothetical protein
MQEDSGKRFFNIFSRKQSRAKLSDDTMSAIHSYRTSDVHMEAGTSPSAAKEARHSAHENTPTQSNPNLPSSRRKTQKRGSIG